MVADTMRRIAPEAQCMFEKGTLTRLPTPKYFEIGRPLIFDLSMEDARARLLVGRGTRDAGKPRLWGRSARLGFSLVKV